MGLFDWLGPLNAGSKARGWSELPAVPERKSSWTIDDHRAVIVTPTLVHGPGLSDRPASDGNSAVYACLQVIATALSEPPLRVYSTKAGARTELEASPLGDLLASVNPHLTLSELLAYVSNCLHIDGNAFWRKLRAGDPESGNVVELWPISPSRIKPMTNPGSGDFISFYRYYHRPGVHEDIPPENIVHFRMGLDDKDHRLGSGPLKRLMREVSSDEQATRYADRLLANLAINGLSLEFDKDAPAMTQAEADEAKARIQAAYSGDNIGSVSIVAPGGKLVQHGFSPEQMDMKTLHRVPEERIAAVLGVPAIVAGLGAGLDRSTYSNFAEAREAFTEMKLVPFWRAISDVLSMSLVSDFTNERGVSVAFMIDDVRALQDDQNAKAVRLKTYVDAGILLVDEAREEIGRDPKPAAQPAPIAALPEQRSARPLILLRKALADLPGAYEDLRDDKEPDWEDALRLFLASQLRRANSILRAGGDTADALIAEGEAILLGEVLAPLQMSLLSDVSRLVIGELGIAFDLDDAATRQYLTSAGSNITGITQTTRSAVQAALIEGQAAGEGIDQLAARLRQLPAFGPKRAVTIARTELGHAQNTAALANYRASGVVVGVTVYDGDYDATCQAMNGRKFPLGQEPATLQHPRCRRAFAPIVDASELERSA
jgi:HK97 family phage portal protein